MQQDNTIGSEHFKQIGKATEPKNSDSLNAYIYSKTWLDAPTVKVLAILTRSCPIIPRWLGILTLDHTERISRPLHSFTALNMASLKS
jgi:hypothetical protein